MLQYGFYPCPFGILAIGYEGEYITSIKTVDKPFAEHSPSPVSERAAAQLAAYFEGCRTTFDLPLAPHGTPFQTAVWDALLQIPYGEMRSYKDIATAIGKPKACRAVGMACSRNPIWVVVPCHRVLGANHALTGYAGGTDMKRALLDLEAHNR